MIDKKDIQIYCNTQRVLVKADDFMYLLPHTQLRNWVSNYTITFPGQANISESYTVIPHGSATLVFSFDEKGICSQMFGPITRPCIVGGQANQAHMLFIIEFQPAGFYAFTGIKQKELSNQVIPFSLIDCMFHKWMAETLERACSIAKLAEGMDRLLLSHLYAPYPVELYHSVQSIVDSKGNISVKELSREVFYSERHMNRLFDNYLGMSVKVFSRLVRINKAARLLHDSQNSITKACDISGFYDLSHFIHEFKSVCGITPQAYRDRMSDFYSEIAKF